MADVGDKKDQLNQNINSPRAAMLLKKIVDRGDHKNF
jgi:hypothetical protein